MPHPKDQESGKGDVASPPQDKTACSNALAWQMLRTFLWFNPLIWIRNLVLHLIFLSEATCYRNPQGENAKKRITGLLTLLESKEKASPEIPSFRGLHESGHPPLSIIVFTSSTEFSLFFTQPETEVFQFLGWFYLPICLLLKIQNHHKTLSSLSTKVILIFFPS